jgi:ATP-dependent Clp protease ATP-binding subunit ClpB
MLQGDIQPGSQVVLDVFGDVVVFRQAREGERVSGEAVTL